MKTKYIPFYLDNNSNNLPFYLIKDKRGNDVIYINDKNMIYTNTKNSNIGQQLNLFTRCFNQGIYSLYKVNDNLSIVKKFINNDVSWYINTNDDFIKIYSDFIDHLEEVNIHFNSKYLCLTSYEYGEAMPEVVAGYDIANNKILDCNDYNTANNLYKSLVEIRRCRFDVIYSILKGEILIEDKDRLFCFMSFIMDEKITDNNYQEYMNIIKNYILKRYPLLCDINLDSIDDIKEYSKGFGINHFYFNRIDTDIPDLKYISNKTKVK